MNIFKRIFGKRNYKTIFVFNCDAMRGSAFTGQAKVDAKVFIKFDKERNSVKCYLTDGELKTNLDISFVASHSEECKKILRENNIDF